MRDGKAMHRVSKIANLFTQMRVYSEDFFSEGAPGIRLYRHPGRTPHLKGGQPLLPGHYRPIMETGSYIFDRTGREN